ncbi:hypothetical protein [Thermorudis peleae]|uniref:hypothetical protein n=1 Tax=Thermorudis peleae TaxID=1382356 RepID=UPI0005709718|nr:hypothetical protein [Thermorudis peleae]MBX6753185.1 hypothetical protein [Thermorudis peleae]
MQQIRPSNQPAIDRGTILLLGIGAFLAVYLLGLARQQPFPWVAISSTIALGVTLVAGSLVARIFQHAERPVEQPVEDEKLVGQRSLDEQ